MPRPKRQSQGASRVPKTGRQPARLRRQRAERRRRLYLRREAIRIAEYLVSGGMYFWSGYLVFFIADSLLGWTLWWAKLAANLVGWTVNYLLQRYWVFRNPELNKHQVEVTGRYIIITGFNFVLDYCIVYGLQQLGITPYIGQFISAGFFTVWNYIWYKTWVFASHIHHRPGRRTPGKRRAAARRSKTDRG